MRAACPWTILIASVIVVIGCLLWGCLNIRPTIVTQTVERRVKVPKSLVSCSSEPVHGKVVVTANDLMAFADQLARAGAECRSKLEAVKRIVDGQQWWHDSWRGLDAIMTDQDVLLAYSQGQLSRRKAVEQLGLRDYADLLVSLGEANLPLPLPPEQEITEQAAAFSMLWRMT